MRCVALLRPIVLFLIVCGVTAYASTSTTGRPVVSAQERSTVPRSPVATTGTVTEGIDVSRHQRRIDWRRVREAGYPFAYIAVSNGLTPDRTFARNWRQSRAHGLIRGAYQLFHPRLSATDQADLMVRLAPRRHGDLPPALDVEYRRGVGRTAIVAGVREWIQRYRAQSGHRVVVIYTREEFWRGLGSPRMPGTILWVSRYHGERRPDVPRTWSRWLFWQWSDRCVIPGIEGNVHGHTDCTQFQGDLAALRSLSHIH